MTDTIIFNMDLGKRFFTGTEIPINNQYWLYAVGTDPGILFQVRPVRPASGTQNTKTLKAVGTPP
jgi:hypothetical protein